MATREERQRRAAEKHASREERVQQWVDRKISRKGMRPRYAAYLVIMTWLIAIAVFGILQRAADPHTYPTIWLAWWWAIQTVTTVGYGDVVPQQTAGKVVAAVLMVGGLAFLSILTAPIKSSFVARPQERGAHLARCATPRDATPTVPPPSASLARDPIGTSAMPFFAMPHLPRDRA